MQNKTDITRTLLKKLKKKRIENKKHAERLTGVRMFIVPTAVIIGINKYIFDNSFNNIEQIFFIIILIALFFLLLYFGDKKVIIEEKTSIIEQKIKKLELKLRETNHK